MRLFRPAMHILDAIKWRLILIHISLITGPLAHAQSEIDEGAGELIDRAVNELGSGFAAAVQIGAGLIGFALIAFSTYGLTMGRKKDEREFPLMATLAMGIGGAVMLGVTAYVGIIGATFFGVGNEDIDLNLLRGGGN